MLHTAILPVHTCNASNSEYRFSTTPFCTDGPASDSDICQSTAHSVRPKEAQTMPAPSTTATAQRVGQRALSFSNHSGVAVRHELIAKKRRRRFKGEEAAGSVLAAANRGSALW